MKPQIFSEIGPLEKVFVYSPGEEHNLVLPSDVQPFLYQDNQMFRLVYQGSKQTKKTTLDKLDPVTVVLTSPTTLVTKETGESKLDVL